MKWRPGLPLLLLALPALSSGGAMEDAIAHEATLTMFSIAATAYGALVGAALLLLPRDARECSVKTSCVLAFIGGWVAAVLSIFLHEFARAVRANPDVEWYQLIELDLAQLALSVSLPAAGAAALVTIPLARAARSRPGAVIGSVVGIGLAGMAVSLAATASGALWMERVLVLFALPSILVALGFLGFHTPAREFAFCWVDPAKAK